VVRRYKSLAVRTRYWRPGEDYLKRVVDSIKNRVEDGDLVTISEKALSTALGGLVDESTVQPCWVARFLAKYWMRWVWGYVLGPLCHLRKKTIRRLREYPIREGSAHKQVALERAGFLQALMFGSEGGIDASNLPYSYVSLPLRNAPRIAREIRERIKSELGRNVAVMIIDTDKTYSLGGFHFTPRPRPLRGIHSLGGVLAYVIGRFFRMKRRATPIAVAGSEMPVEEALEISEVANRARGFGAGRTVWDMAETFGVPLTCVTWDMLDRVVHRPIVIVKPRR
jgi:F420-0:gamma-glutamyl ligase-like protein